MIDSLFYLSIVKWVPGIPGYLVVNSKLSPLSGFIGLSQLRSIHKKDHDVFDKNLP